MSDKKRFRHAWHEFRLNEGHRPTGPAQNYLNEAGYLATTQKGIGQAPAVKDLPPEEQQAIAIIVDEIDRKPADKCDPKALASPDPFRIVVMASVNESGLNWVGRQISCAMIDTDVSFINRFFERTGESTSCTRELEEATSFSRRNVDDFFTFQGMVEPQAATGKLSEEVWDVDTGTELPDEKGFGKSPPPDPAPKEPEQKNQPLATQNALKSHLEGRLTDLFKCLKWDHVKFVLAIGIITYWETLIEQDFLGLKSKNPILFNNARMIAEIEIAWLRRTAIEPLPAKINQWRIENRKFLQIAAKAPAAPEQFVHNRALMTFLKKLRRSSGINFEPQAVRTALKPVFSAAQGTPLRERAEKPSIIKLEDMFKALMNPKTPVPYADPASRKTGAVISEDEAWKVANAVADWLEQTQHVNIKVVRPDRAAEEPAPKEKPKRGGTVPQGFEWPQMKKGGMMNESVYREERQKQNNRWKQLAGIK